MKLDELNELNQEVSLIINTLLLSLSSSDDNSQFINCIKDCGAWTRSINDAWRNIKSRDTDISYDTTVIKNMTIVSQDYYKREWEKAKAGK